MKPWLNVLWVALAAAGGYLTALNKTGVEEAPRTITEVVEMDLGDTIKNAKLVDLTQRMEEGMPQGPSGNEPPTIRP